MMENTFFAALSAFFLSSAIFHFLRDEIVEGFLIRPLVIKVIGAILISASVWGLIQDSIYSRIAGLLSLASGIWRFAFTQHSIRFQQSYYPRWVHGFLLGIGAIVCGYFSVAKASAATPTSYYNIEQYSVSLELDFANQSIKGSTQIHFKRHAEKSVEFPIYGLAIDSVEIDKKAAAFTVDSSVLKVELPLNPEKKFYSIQVHYHGKPERGLVWGSNYVYTNYDPCGWMICLDNPGLRVPFELELNMPKRMKAVASGDWISISEKSKGTQIIKWYEKRPYASYLYGFAVGEFEQLLEKSRSFELEFIGSSDSKDELKKKFVKFFEEKAGVKLPLKRYTQVLVPGNEAQEKHSFSVLGKDFVDPILTDPTEDWAIVHELAHQWWGNLLTCMSWEHFWLNEGLTVFMTAAYNQNRWGQTAYDREIELAKKRYQKAIDANFDVPLTFAGEYPLGLKRPIVYSKGFLFINELRKEMGEKAFWKGIKSYTRKNQLRSVVSRDFQRVMEETAGKDLAKLFNQWVY